MNLLRSLCCFVASRCGVGEPRSTKETMRGEPFVRDGDLGQKEAQLEKTGKERMSHMEGGEDSKLS